MDEQNYANLRLCVDNLRFFKDRGLFLDAICAARECKNYLDRINVELIQQSQQVVAGDEYEVRV